MPGNLEARVASLRKARSDQAIDSSLSSSSVREPYSSWLEGGGERLEEWLAEQNVDRTRRRASVQEQTTLALLGAVDKMSTKTNGFFKEDLEAKVKEDLGSKLKGDEEPRVGITRRRTTGEIQDEGGDMLTGVGAFAGDEVPRQNNPQLSFTFSQQEDQPVPNLATGQQPIIVFSDDEDEPMPDAPPLDSSPGASKELPACS